MKIKLKLKIVTSFIKMRMMRFYLLIRFLIANFIMIQINYKMFYHQKIKFLMFHINLKLKIINLIKNF